MGGRAQLRSVCSARDRRVAVAVGRLLAWDPRCPRAGCGWGSRSCRFLPRFGQPVRPLLAGSTLGPGGRFHDRWKPAHEPLRRSWPDGSTSGTRSVVEPGEAPGRARCRDPVTGAGSGHASAMAGFPARPANVVGGTGSRLDRRNDQAVTKSMSPRPRRRGVARGRRSFTEPRMCFQKRRQGACDQPSRPQTPSFQSRASERRASGEADRRLHRRPDVDERVSGHQDVGGEATSAATGTPSTGHQVVEEHADARGPGPKSRRIATRSSTPSSISTTTPSMRRSSPHTFSTSSASCRPSTRMRLARATGRARRVRRPSPTPYGWAWRAPDGPGLPGSPAGPRAGSPGRAGRYGACRGDPPA